MKSNGDFATNDDLKQFLNGCQQRTDPKYLDFIRGYMSHIYADREWTFTVYREFEKHSTDKSIYNMDVNKIEFLLTRSTEWFEEVIQKLNKASCFDVGGLTRQEILAYKDEKIAYLSDPLNEPSNVPGIITLDMVERFVNGAVLELKPFMIENVSPGAKI